MITTGRRGGLAVSVGGAVVADVFYGGVHAVGVGVDDVIGGAGMEVM